jgi:hypothetical protein
MSERWPKFGSKQPSDESEAGGPSSGNGADPGEAAGVPDKPGDEPAVASADLAPDSATASVTAAAPVPAAAAEAPVAHAEAAATGQGDAAAAGQGEVAADVAKAAPPADDAELFMAELVRAMRTTVGLERARIGEDTDRRRQDRIDELRAREAAEADRMRELAGEDKKAISSWADGETMRIHLERERREKELNADLEASLAAHRSRIDGEIQSLEAAIALYRTQVDAFFERLDRETDPVLIAQQAARRPIFPKLEAALETPSPNEPTMVGVMAPDPVAAEALAARIASWPSASAAPTEGASAGSSSDVGGGQTRESAEPVVTASSPSPGGGDSLLDAVPAVRPMSWLRRGGNGGDDGSNRQD